VRSRTSVKFLKIFIVLSLILGTILFFYTQYLSHIVTEKFSGPKWDLPSKVYSDALQLYPGLDIRSVHLKEKLDRLGYQEVSDPVSRPSEYHVEGEQWAIYLNDFSYPLKKFTGFPLFLDIEDSVITKLYQKKDEEIPLAELEPELITEFFGSSREDRQLVKLEEVPPNLLNAIISVEDARFLEHSGVDPKGIFRAFFTNLKNLSIVQGGSTITQQLVKNFFLTQKRSYIRKLNEALMALIVESRYSKDAILEAYVNEVYMGQRGSTGIYGIAEASKFYFSKSLEKLSLSECALLAGIIRGPGVFSPFKNKSLATKRRNVVLRKMLETNTLIQSEYEEALKDPLKVKKFLSPPNIAPYFVDFVKMELLESYSEKVLNTQGLKIFTTLDPLLQIFANQAMAVSLKHLEANFPHLKDSSEDILQGAFMAIQPQTGFIRALIGGRNYTESQFNRITQAHRQPGSLFKPFVFLTAFSIDHGKKYKLTDILSNEPFTLTYDKQVWEPTNYVPLHPDEKEEEKETVTLRETLEQSINIPTARLASEIGFKKVAQMIKKLGIQSPMPAIPSLALGSKEVTPLEIATAYSVLANGGIRATPISIKQVVDPEGNVLERRSIEVEKVASEEATYLITYALEGVLNSGTGRGVKLFGFTKPAAGKTGTTNEYMDAWFSGYTPDLVGVAWVGYDKEKKVGLTGAQAALPIWTRFMLKATEYKPEHDFLVPEDIVFATIDPESGELASKKCPGSFKEAFMKGTEPKRVCELHNPKKKKKKK